MSVLQIVLATVVPVFAVVGLGWMLGRRGNLDINPFVDWVIYVAQPALILQALTTHHLALDHLLSTGLGNLFVLGVTGVAGVLYVRLSGDRGPEVLLCGLFANAANLPLPLAQFAFGDEGLAHQVVYMTVNAVMLYTVGVAIATGGGGRGLAQVFKLPLIYAAAIAIGLSVGEVEVPVYVARPVGMLGDTAIPLMLFTLGFKMGSMRHDRGLSVTPIVLLRAVGGAAAGLLFVWLFEPPTQVARAVLLGSAMPSAVQTFMLSAKFSPSPARAATAVFTSTAVALVYIPFLVGWLTTLG